MADQVIPIAFTVLGYAVGSALGAPWLGAAIGGWTGGQINRWLFPIDPVRIEGPRLDRLQVQTSSYAAPVPQLWGTVRMAGNMIWATDIQEVPTHKVEDVGGQTIEYTNYYYFGTFAVGLCEGEIDRILRVWADTKLIYSLRAENDEIVAIANLDMRVHTGSATQEPDGIIESFEGVGNVPGHRGMA